MAKEDRILISYDRLKRQFVGITPELLTELENTFPTVNVVQEIKKMALWLMTPKGAKRKGNLKFILSWLTRSIPEAPTICQPVNFEDSDSPLPLLVKTYLDELWQGKDNLFHFNSKRMPKTR